MSAGLVILPERSAIMLIAFIFGYLGMEQLPRLAHDAVSASSSAFHFVQKQRTLVLTTLTTGIEREKHHE